MKAELEKEGFAVFFYEFCSPRCSAEAVGAFFATAGNAILAATPEVERSLYVLSEVATAQRMRKGQRLMILVTPEQAIRAAEIGLGTTAVLMSLDVKTEK